MEDQDKGRFLQMLIKAMGAYGKSLPAASIIEVWIDLLRPFPLRTVGMAFAAYLDENGEFEPKPAGIAKLCKLMDGRPSDEEAWAIALTSRSEEETVVWTAETAEAFALCSPVLAMGDEVGARMAFKDAYNRLVSAARLANKPCKWNVSLGWDVSKREVALSKAQAAGLLSAPAVQHLLTNHSDFIGEPSPEGLKMVKEALAAMQDGWEKAAQAREAAIQAERDAVAKRKQELAAQAEAGLKRDAA
jgi:hypothetical protein